MTKNSKSWRNGHKKEKEKDDGDKNEARKEREE